MKFFMAHTPLAGLERQMMAPPGFMPRGRGKRRFPRFRYKPEDVDCKLCTEYKRRRCTAPSCPWLAERLEAGVVNYQTLVMECFKELHNHPLTDRVKRLIRGRDSLYMEGEDHKLRLSFWRAWLTRREGLIDHQPLAALYLLTARASLWNRVQPYLNDSGAGVSLRGIGTQEYALFQTAKLIHGGEAGITAADLADESVVDDDTLRLIVDAAVLCRYGQAALYVGKGAQG